MTEIPDHLLARAEAAKEHEMTDGWAAMLNDVTLADRLRAIVAEPRRWSKADRDALILAAAARLDSVYGSPARRGPVGRLEVPEEEEPPARAAIQNMESDIEP